MAKRTVVDGTADTCPPTPAPVLRTATVRGCKYVMDPWAVYVAQLAVRAVLAGDCMAGEYDRLSDALLDAHLAWWTGKTQANR